MGCTSLNSKARKLDEFFLEAFGFNKKNEQGVNVDDSAQTKTSEILGANKLTFREEIIEHGDESGVIKPWLENMLSPDLPLEEDLSFPNYSLRIEHVWGFRIEDCRKNLFFLSKDQILYSSSSLGIIQNLDDNTQTLFGGFPLEKDKQCHDKDITAIAYLKKDVSMIATGQPGINPKILVWSPVDPEVIYAQFEQPEGSKLVSCLSFDHTGRYLGSFGKDENNSFYIFDLKNKNLYWNEMTSKKEENIGKQKRNLEIKKQKEKENMDENDINENQINELNFIDLDNTEYLLDMCFNPHEKELCLVGVEKVIFANYDNRQLFKKSNIPGRIRKIYTSCCYVDKNTCLVGSNHGKLYFFKDRKKLKSKRISNGSIQNITFKKHIKRVYISDSFCKVLIYDSKGEECLDYFVMNSVVKSLDVSIDNKIIMGLKNGEVKIKYYGTATKHEQSIIKAHCMGNINDIVYIPEKKILTVGDDNKLLLFNLLSKKCQSSGNVNIITYNNLEQSIGKCISYNKTKENIAIGLSNGYISIRKDVKNLDIKILNDIEISKGSIVTLKYTDYGDFLLCCSELNELCLIDVNDNYNINKKINIDGIIYKFDWDREGKHIQGIKGKNKYVFYKVDKDSIELKNPNDMVSIEWPEITCKFNYTVQGVFQGSINPDYINCVAKAHNKKLICSGDEHYLLHLCNYPCVSDNLKKKKYRGHSGKIKNIIWNFDDSKIITIAENDKSIILWSLEEDLNDKNAVEEKINL